MPKKKLPVTGSIKVKPYEVLARCVEEGVDYGWARAHKHESEPASDYIKSQVYAEVMNAICEYFDFLEGT